MVDRDDDIRLGMRTSAITFGRFDVLAVALCYAVYLAGHGCGSATRARWASHYWAGSRSRSAAPPITCGSSATRERDRCFRAFLNNHWLGFAVFAGIAVDFAWRLKAWPRML